MSCATAPQRCSAKQRPGHALAVGLLSCSNDGADLGKEVLVQNDDVQVLHGFDTSDNAKAYLESELFSRDVVGGLSVLLAADPAIRIYDVV